MTIFRWILSVLFAAIVFILGIGVFTIIGPHIGSHGYSLHAWSIAIGTIFSVISGTYIAPKNNRKIAPYILLGLILIFIMVCFLIDVVNHEAGWDNAFDLIGLALGGPIVARFFHRLT